MIAYKCDICGRFFSEDDHQSVNSVGLVICNRKYFSGSGNYDNSLADVCPECNKAFHKLMTKLKEKEITDERKE